MVSSLASFAQLQSDIKATEQEAFKGMLEGQLTSELSMTNYTTLLEQEKSAFYQGEAFSIIVLLLNFAYDGRFASSFSSCFLHGFVPFFD